MVTVSSTVMLKERIASVNVNITVLVWNDGVMLLVIVVWIVFVKVMV